MLLRLSRLPCVAFAIALALPLTGPALRAETKSFDMLDLLRALKIAPNTEAIATRQGYVLHGIQNGTADAKPQAGDTVTALVELGSFFGKRPRSQWIIRLQLAAKTPAESPAGQPSDVVLYTNTGEKFTFHSELSGMKLETLGPIKADAKPDQPLPVKHREIFAATDFLSLNLYRTTLVVRRLNDSNHNPGLSLAASPRPFPADEVNMQRPRAETLNLTSDDLRSFSGSAPALSQFLRIVRLTPDLQDILFQVLDKPSLIDVFRHGADSSLNFNFRLGHGAMGGQEIFWPDAKHGDFGGLMFDLEVFKKPVLRVMLFVTNPRPPLMVSAGIVGIVAFSPSKPDRFVAVRVLSATGGAETVSPQSPAAPIP